MALTPMAGGRVRIYVRGRLRLDLLTPEQRHMKRIGDFAIEVWKRRNEAGINSSDQPSKSLTKGYARFKARRGGQPIRNLRGVGPSPRMLDNFSVRTVSETSLRAGFTTTAARIKAQANQKIEPFMEFSPRDQQAISEFSQAVLVMERIPKLAIQIDQ